MKAKYILMLRDVPMHVLLDAYNVRPLECICVTKQNRGLNIMGLIPKGLKVLRYKHRGNYNLDDVEPIPDDWETARDIRNELIDEARGW